MMPYQARIGAMSQLVTPTRTFGNAPSRTRPWEIVKTAFNNVQSVSVLLPVGSIFVAVILYVCMYYESTVRHKSEAALKFAEDYHKVNPWTTASHSDDYDYIPGSIINRGRGRE